MNETDELWDCPSCGFAFDAVHEDVDPVTGEGNGNYTCPLCELDEKDAEIKRLKEQIERRDKALEWANRIIGSGLDIGAELRYDPRYWLVQYHEHLKAETEQ